MKEPKVHGLEYLTMARLNGRAVVMIGVAKHFAVVRFVGETKRFSVLANLLENF
jgi:hypothetical protein